MAKVFTGLFVGGGNGRRRTQMSPLSLQKNKPVTFQVNSTLHSTDNNFSHLNLFHLQYFEIKLNSICPLFFPTFYYKLTFSFISFVINRFFLLISMITSFFVTLYFTFFHISYSSSIY